MDEHELVVAVKELALELGRPPRRLEFERHIKGGKYKLDTSSFGNFTALLHAAGLETYHSPKITNAIFERPIEKHLEGYEPRTAPERKPYPSIAVISDTHFPFVSKRVLERFYEYVGDAKPEWVILNGDAADLYSHSKFPRSHNLFTPREEMAAARKANEEFWAEVKTRAPKACCVQMIGNHDVRPLKRVLEVYPAAEDWIAEKLNEFFTFAGVRTVFDAREELMIGDIAVFHGYRSQLGAHRDFTLYNCINGHTHKGGTVFKTIRGGVLWELNSGVSGDPETKGLTYTPQKIIDWTPGFGVVDRLGPRFIAV